MKFLVDSLPYYGGACPFLSNNLCIDFVYGECPIFWGEDKVCSDGNPHECEWLKEITHNEM